MSSASSSSRSSSLFSSFSSSGFNSSDSRFKIRMVNIDAGDQIVMDVEKSYLSRYEPSSSVRSSKMVGEDFEAVAETKKQKTATYASESKHPI